MDPKHQQECLRSLTAPGKVKDYEERLQALVLAGAPVHLFEHLQTRILIDVLKATGAK